MDNQITKTTVGDIILTQTDTKTNVSFVPEGKTEPEPTLKTNLEHAKLLSGLYFLYDAFGRAMLDFFLVKQTAKDAMTGHQLSGDKITIGVRNLEWASDTKEILFAYFDSENVQKTEDLPDRVSFVWQDIPFTIYLYEDSEPLTALNTLTYEYESWHIPNQFERFEREFDK